MRVPRAWRWDGCGPDCAGRGCCVQCALLWNVCFVHTVVKSMHTQGRTLYTSRRGFSENTHSSTKETNTKLARWPMRGLVRERERAGAAPLRAHPAVRDVAPPRGAYRIFLYILSQKSIYSLSTLHYTVVSLLYTPTHAARSARPAAHTAPTAARWVGNSDGVVMGESLCAALRARS